MAATEGPATGHGRRIRGAQDVLGGVVVVAIACIALLVLGRMSGRSFSAFSPALFPQLCCYALVAGGLVLTARGLLREGPGLEGMPWRPAILVTLAIVVFGAVTPILGYAVAGLMTLLIGGLATPQARPRELALVSVAVLALSVALFSGLLKLSLPLLILPGLRL